METGSIAVAVSILVLTPIAIALLYLIWRGAKALYANAADRWSVGLPSFVAAWLILFPLTIFTSLVLGIGAVLAERAQRMEAAESQAAEDQEELSQTQVDATAGTGLYEEEMSDYEKRRGY